MADLLVDQGQQPIAITQGDDITFPLHLVVKKTKIAPDGTTVIQKFDFSLLSTDQIQVLFPDTNGNPIILDSAQGMVQIANAQRGVLSAEMTGNQSYQLALSDSSNPGTFKARVIRNGKRFTFIFAGLLIVKADDFSPFM